jgi:hypothetical protein
VIFCHDFSFGLYLTLSEANDPQEMKETYPKPIVIVVDTSLFRESSRKEGTKDSTLISLLAFCHQSLTIRKAHSDHAIMLTVNGG